MQFLEDPFNLLSRPKLIRLSGVFAFLAPAKSPGPVPCHLTAWLTNNSFRRSVIYHSPRKGSIKIPSLRYYYAVMQASSGMKLDRFVKDTTVFQNQRHKNNDRCLLALPDRVRWKNFRTYTWHNPSGLHPFR